MEFWGKNYNDYFDAQIMYFILFIKIATILTLSTRREWYKGQALIQHNPQNYLCIIIIAHNRFIKLYMSTVTVSKVQDVSPGL